LDKTGLVLYRFFFLPDYTVGSGLSPDQPFRFAGFMLRDLPQDITAGSELKG